MCRLLFIFIFAVVVVVVEGGGVVMTVLVVVVLMSLPSFLPVITFCSLSPVTYLFCRNCSGL